MGGKKSREGSVQSSIWSEMFSITSSSISSRSLIMLINLGLQSHRLWTLWCGRRGSWMRL